MTLIITENINPADQEELLAGLREYNLRFLDPAQFGELGVYSRDDAGAMRGGLIGKRRAAGCVLTICGSAKPRAAAALASS